MTGRLTASARARHVRTAERLSIGQIAERLARTSATVEAYFYDSTGERPGVDSPLRRAVTGP